MTVLVCGATGRVGRRVLERLSSQGLPVRAMVRREDADLPVSCERVIADLDAPASLVGAMAGIQALLLVSPQSANLARRETAAIEAAQVAGVSHIVKVSGGSAMVGPNSESPVGREHALVEAALRGAGLGWTILRPSAFMQVVLAPLWAQAVESGQVLLPIGDGRVSFIDVQDIARTAAWALANPAASDRRVLELTGPEALTLAQVAETMGAALKRDIRAISPPLQAVEPMIRARFPDPVLQDHQLAMLALMAADHLSGVTKDVDVSGRPATSVAEWLTTLPKAALATTERAP